MTFHTAPSRIIGLLLTLAVTCALIGASAAPSPAASKSPSKLAAKACKNVKSSAKRRSCKLKKLKKLCAKARYVKHRDCKKYAKPAVTPPPRPPVVAPPPPPPPPVMPARKKYFNCADNSVPFALSLFGDGSVQWMCANHYQSTSSYDAPLPPNTVFCADETEHYASTVMWSAAAPAVVCADGLPPRADTPYYSCADNSVAVATPSSYGRVRYYCANHYQATMSWDAPLPPNTVLCADGLEHYWATSTHDGVVPPVLCGNGLPPPPQY